MKIKFQGRLRDSWKSPDPKYTDVNATFSDKEQGGDIRLRLPAAEFAKLELDGLYDVDCVVRGGISGRMSFGIVFVSGTFKLVTAK